MNETMSCQLVHHGAAASSSSHAVVWIPVHHKQNDKASSMVVYSSHGIVNVAVPRTVLLGSCRQEVWNVEATLRTSTIGQENNLKRVITCLAHVRSDDSSGSIGLATGFSDGTVNAWWKNNEGGEPWEESVLVEPPNSDAGRAITDIDGLLFSDKRVAVVTCTSDGALFFQSNGSKTDQHRLASFATNAVRMESMPFDKIMILIGTAHPRHNKIHVYTTNMDKQDTVVHHCGHLSGHQDWITAFDWNTSHESAAMLASASQDAKIRLWKFTTTDDTPTLQGIKDSNQEDVLPTLSEDEDSDNDLDLSDDDEGEARLEIMHDKSVTSVTLEALLLGHEEAVTSVNWHPNPMPYYGHELILISSSMDRTLLIWGPTDSGGVWTPLTRVGSAGGILGGSIGSSLLGFVNAAVEPLHGRCLLGHAYGGALHFWSLENDSITSSDADEPTEGTLSIDEIASQNKWRATPCLTGHFDGVTDLCWEAESGEYLLTVSVDQTCRLWAPAPTENSPDVWVELARPQVHGYDLNAITSVSTSEHRHLIASGADEKELRIFDAPLTTVRLLRAVRGDVVGNEHDGRATSRVERAYLPALGLSNKATAGDSAEEEGGDAGNAQSEGGDQEMHLPLERDLGVISLWPEVRKLFGHNTELFCLTSTVSARTGPKWTSSPFAANVLVASTAKARDVEAASIRMWDVEQGKCVQVLAGGHRSTVATVIFSPDGRYLASSGKDRRLCIWKRQHPTDVTPDTPPSFELASAIDSAHKRIIWSVHFCPHNPSILASGSRDGCIKIWNVAESSNAEETNTTTVETIHSLEPLTRSGKKADSVTALAFAPRSIKNPESSVQRAVLAVGVESGMIELWSIPIPSSDGERGESPCNLLCLPSWQCHFSTITKLAWKRSIRHVSDEGGGDKPQKTSKTMLLASASMDHGCRVFEISL